MRQLLFVTTALVAIAPLAPLRAQDARSAAVAVEDAEAADDDHRPYSTDIIVTAPFQRDRQDVLSGVSILQAQELAQALRPTIGDTLAQTPGVSATSFGPNASRPVLRGLQGERIRVLTDGIGSIDVSNTSVDHAVVIDPLLAERIEVLRGPQSLLYGSSAIGGVVNVVDKRIPRTVPTEPVHFDAIGGYGSAADERSVGGAIDVPVGDKLVLHADGSYRKTDDLEIGSFVLSRRARATAIANAGTEDDEQVDEGIDFAENATLRDRLPNSASRTWTAGVGAAIVTETGNLGVSYSRYDSLYGVPVRYAIAPGQLPEGPRLDIRQDRVDLRAEVQTGGGFLERIRARAGFADYRHAEIEETGEIATTFLNKGIEGRLEFVQAERGGWRGASGVQYVNRDFNVVGEEAFLPKNSTQQFGVFTLQQFDLGALHVEGGARYEHSRLSASPGPDEPQFFTGERRFDAFSASLGASVALGEDWRLGANVSRTERAPSAEELFPNGPHAGTQAFEIGDPGFGKERSWGVEGVLRGRGEGYSFEASAYYNWFNNFIYEDQTGEIEDGLPVFQYRQAKARYYGFEVQASATLARLGQASVVVDGLADYVRARIVDFGPAPRIPPLRLIGGIGVTSPRIDVRGEVEYADDQDRVAAFETPTDSFTLVNAEVNIRPWGRERPLSFALSANNIFDVDARRHASFLKDFAPLAGRDFRISARVNF